MDFAPSPQAQDLADRLQDFLVARVLPPEQEYDDARAAAGPDDYTVPPVVERLKGEARALGLWNLFLPAVSGLSNVEYAPLAEITGWSNDILPEAVNCQAPDTWNMETLHLFATAEQRERWRQPLLEGEIRSAPEAAVHLDGPVDDGGCDPRSHASRSSRSACSRAGDHHRLRIFDGPEEVHLRTMAKAELRRG